MVVCNYLNLTNVHFVCRKLTSQNNSSGVFLVGSGLTTSLSGIVGKKLFIYFKI